MLRLKHHSADFAARWQGFSLGKQLVMIANELNRAGHWIARGDPEEARLCHERALDLFYLTIREARGYALLRELARAKETLLSLYCSSPAGSANAQLQAGLIALSAESFALLNPK
jgi:hypothetical protein